MISARWLANPNRDRSHFPYNFWRSSEYLIRYQSEDTLAHKMVKYIPHVMLTTELRMVKIF